MFHHLSGEHITNALKFTDGDESTALQLLMMEVVEGAKQEQVSKPINNEKSVWCALNKTNKISNIK